MAPRRAAKKRGRQDVEEAKEQPGEGLEQQQVQQRNKRERSAAPATLRAADAAPDEDADADADAATERESEPTGFQGLTSEAEEGVDGSVEQPKRQRRRRLDQAAAAAAPAAPPPPAPAPAPPPPRLSLPSPASAAAAARKVSPLALTLYVRWWAPDGLKTRVHEIPLRAVGSADDLAGLPRDLVRRLFGVSPSLPAGAPLGPHLPAHAAGPDFYRFTPAGGREFLSAPGPIAAFEIRLAVSAGGWEHTIADRGGGGLGGPGDVVVAVTEFESPPVGAGDGLPRALLPMLRLPLIAYPLVCVRRAFLDRVENMLTGRQAVPAAADAGGAGEGGPPPARASSSPWRRRPPPCRVVPEAQPPLPGADMVERGSGGGVAGGGGGGGGAVAFSAEAVSTFDGQCAPGVASSLGRPDGGRGLGDGAAVALERAAAVRPIVPL